MSSGSLTESIVENDISIELLVSVAFYFVRKHTWYILQPLILRQESDRLPLTMPLLTKLRDKLQRPF